MSNDQNIPSNTESLAADRTQLHGALYRVALELSGCPRDCSHDFHRLAIASGLKIAKDALARVAPAPANHEEAQAMIASAVRQIEQIADTFGYDPHQWLADSPDETTGVPASRSVSGETPSIAGERVPPGPGEVLTSPDSTLEPQPIPVREIISALEREGFKDDIEGRWLLTQGLRRLKDWQTRTLMCRIDQRPSEVVGAQIHPREGDNRDVSAERRRSAAAVSGTPESYSRSDPSEDARTPAGANVASPALSGDSRLSEKAEGD